MLTIEYTSKMKRDTKRMARRGKNMSKLVKILDILASELPVPEIYKDHALKGAIQGYRECHIEPDWLLVYRIENKRMILFASGTGSHSDLFDE